MSRLWCVHFCRPSPMGNLYNCSEQALLRVKTSVGTPQFDDVLQHFEKNPSIRTRMVGHTLSMNRLVYYAVHEQQLHLFHWQKVQAQLGPKDYLRQDQFVNWFVHQSTEKPSFPAMVVFIDEACCTRKLIFNSHNNHVWAEVNPHAATVHCHQQCFVVNVWVDNDFLIGPYLLP